MKSSSYLTITNWILYKPICSNLNLQKANFKKPDIIQRVIWKIWGWNHSNFKLMLMLIFQRLSALSSLSLTQTINHMFRTGIIFADCSMNQATKFHRSKKITTKIREISSQMKSVQEIWWILTLYQALKTITVLILNRFLILHSVLISMTGNKCRQI